MRGFTLDLFHIIKWIKSFYTDMQQISVNKMDTDTHADLKDFNSGNFFTSWCWGKEITTFLTFKKSESQWSVSELSVLQYWTLRIEQRSSRISSFPSSLSSWSPSFSSSISSPSTLSLSCSSSRWLPSLAFATYLSSLCQAKRFWRWIENVSISLCLDRTMDNKPWKSESLQPANCFNQESR